MDFSSPTTSRLLSPSEFTAAAAAAFLAARPSLKVHAAADLELIADGGNQRWFLNNAYDQYRGLPGAMAALLEDHVASWLESMDRPVDAVIDRTRIVPVIKDQAWLQEARQATLQRGGKEISPIWETYNEELVILYAEDSQHGLRYFLEEDLKAVGLDKSELRELAIANLPQRIPSLQRHGQNGTYMIVADGNFESSLILLNDIIWDAGVADVAGEILVAIPTRDVLLVTGLEQPGGIDWIRRTIAKVLDGEAAYRLTSKLFVYRSGRFEVFE